MKILITGGNGNIAKMIKNNLSFNYDIQNPSRQELNILNYHMKKHKIKKLKLLNLLIIKLKHLINLMNILKIIIKVFYHYHVVLVKHLLHI